MKKITAFIITLLLFININISAFAAETEDTYSSWSMNYIQDAESMYNILPASMVNSDYTKVISREQFCELAYETMAYISGYTAYYDALSTANENGKSFDVSAGLYKIYPTAINQTSPFTDTSDERIIYLNRIGIILGKGDGLFAPDDLLTREEAATILGRIADHFSLQQFDNKLDFTDATEISDWAVDGVNAVCGMGLMNGMGNGIFSPQTYFTREQAIATMIREIDAVPYLCNREKISESKYFVFNFFWLWVENDNGEVQFKLPMYCATYNYRTDYGYSGVRFFTKDNKLLAAAYGSSNDSTSLSYKKNGTTIFDMTANNELFFIPSSGGSFFALTKDHSAIIMQDTRYSAPTVDAAYSVYAVYDFRGNALIPPGSSWADLFKAGYVDTEYSVNYAY